MAARRMESYNRGYSASNSRAIMLQDLVDEEALLRDRHVGSPGTALALARRGDMSSSMVRQLPEYGGSDESCYFSMSPRNLTDPLDVLDLVRKTNRRVDQVNRGISSGANYSEVHPKMRADGSYPRDFELAKTVDEFDFMDAHVLDRILISYGLLSTISGRGRDIRKQKLWKLFEYLGADHLTPKDPSYAQRQHEQMQLQLQRHNTSSW